jgi:hypothetical protein
MLSTAMASCGSQYFSSSAAKTNHIDRNSVISTLELRKRSLESCSYSAGAASNAETRTIQKIENFVGFVDVSSELRYIKDVLLLVGLHEI